SSVEIPIPNNAFETLFKKVNDLDLALLKEKSQKIKLEKKITKLKKKTNPDKQKQKKYDSQINELDNKHKTALEAVEFYKETSLDAVQKAVNAGNSVFPVIGGAVGGLIGAFVLWSNIGTAKDMYQNEKTEKLLQKAYENK
ncbi:20683_t:CDS:1, partial [Cetraspora pellucida]